MLGAVSGQGPAIAAGRGMAAKVAVGLQPQRSGMGWGVEVRTAPIAPPPSRLLVTKPQAESLPAVDYSIASSLSAKKPSTAVGLKPLARKLCRLEGGPDWEEATLPTVSPASPSASA